MINDIYFHLDDKLYNEFKILKFEKDNDVFLFLKKYIKYIESDNECYIRYFTQKNPLNDKINNKMLMENFNKKIENYLDQTLKNSKDIIKKKSKEANTTCFLGTAYQYGLFNKPKNYNVAFYYYTISAQLNSVYGTFKLAECYEQGIGTAINQEKAIYFYRCASKLGSSDGMHVYGTILYNGFLNCKKDQDLGRHYLTLAALKAESIYPYSLFDMGKLYENKQNDKEVHTDNEYAIEMYFKGVKLGDPNCMYRIAKAYETGDILNTNDPDKSYEYYKMAAKHGHVAAQIRLSELYFQGKTKKNKSEFYKSYMWALTAATKGNGRASYLVGEYAMNGCGLNKDKLLALWWFMISSNYGYEGDDLKLNDLKDWVNLKNEGVFEEPGCCKLFC